MHKFFLWVSLFALLASLLCGCTFHITEGETTGETEEDTQMSSTASEPSAQSATEQTAEMTTPSDPATQPSETDPPAQPDPSGLYLVTVTWADHPVYSGPGYSHTCVGTVQEAGVYTIMEEVWDDAGNLWGRLKSGMGWINVTGLKKNNQPVTADFADEYLLLHGYYYNCVGSQSEHAVAIVFRAQEDLHDVQLSALTLGDAGYALGETLGAFPELPPDTPLVAWLDFPGDLSAYCISFTDRTDAVRHYLLTISGKDGSVELYEFRPN